jgi:hypothetical protein
VGLLCYVNILSPLFDSLNTDSGFAFSFLFKFEVFQNKNKNKKYYLRIVKSTRLSSLGN